MSVKCFGNFNFIPLLGEVFSLGVYFLIEKYLHLVVCGKYIIVTFFHIMTDTQPSHSI